MIDRETIVLATLGLGLGLGTVMLLAVVYVFVRHRLIAASGSLLTLVGALLLGLSVWSSVEFSVGADGGVSATFKQAEDLGAATAEINADIAAANRRVAALEEQLLALVPQVPGASLPDSAAEADSTELAANRSYTALVFYKPSQRLAAERVERALLAAGYRSSRTATDLSESARQFGSGSAWILYTETGQSRLADIRELVSSVAEGFHVEIREEPSTLRRGDLQILLY